MPLKEAQDVKAMLETAARRGNQGAELDPLVLRLPAKFADLAAEAAAEAAAAVEIELAVPGGAAERARVAFRHMDPCSLAPDMGPFDAVLLSGVLERIASPKAPLGERERERERNACAVLCCAAAFPLGKALQQRLSIALPLLHLTSPTPIPRTSRCECRAHGRRPGPGQAGRPAAGHRLLLLERAHRGEPAVAGRHARLHRRRCQVGLGLVEGVWQRGSKD